MNGSDTNDQDLEPEGELPVLRSVEAVVDRSRSVFYRPEHIGGAVGQWGHLVGGEAAWSHPTHFFDGTEETVRWIFTLTVLNHCFWPEVGEPTWTVSYRGEGYSGYWGLAASLKRAVEGGLPVTDASFLSTLSAQDLREVFTGEGEIPLFKERLENLREAGRVLLTRWGGDIVNLLKAAAGSAVRAVLEVASSFPSLRDEALYNGRRVYFWKRAQIFASDLHLAFGGKSWGEFKDIGSLTAFADYKLPQVLRAFGVISYDPGLSGRIDRLEKIVPGSEEEVEIRAMTIWAVEAIKAEFLKRGMHVTSTAVDNWLWQLGQLEPFRQKPYHRCRTIYY